MDIGWVGLGGIGTGMVLRALEHGHSVTVYPRGAGLDAACTAGAAVGGSYAEIAAASDILALNLFDDTQLKEVLLDGGALAEMRAGTAVVIHTTGSPALARHIGAVAPDAVAVIDAAFSGGPNETSAGTITIIAGGDAGAIARVRPLLNSYAAKIHHVGPLGSGQTVKLLNNLLFSSNLQNAVEILKLGAGQGFDTGQIARILQDCSAASFAGALFQSGTSVDAMLGSARHYMRKDVASAAAAAREAGMTIDTFAPTIRYFTED